MVAEGKRKPDISVHWGEDPMISRASVTKGHHKSELNVKNQKQRKIIEITQSYSFVCAKQQ